MENLSFAPIKIVRKRSNFKSFIKKYLFGILKKVGISFTRGRTTNLLQRIVVNNESGSFKTDIYPSAI